MLLIAVAVGLTLLPVVGAPQIWLLYLFYFFVFLAAANMWNLLAGFSGLLALCPAAFIGLGGYAIRHDHFSICLQDARCLFRHWDTSRPCDSTTGVSSLEASGWGSRGWGGRLYGKGRPRYTS